ncbi:PREDICTED: piggyBac transposable element-derived protein 4-like [Acropora digitifera]|uniref:piggyBac transposable element-derived protein 4-like n=1 Tax=Acropora digitifera TaxID=70779 RepID=UPI00077B1D5A|nr:PREDICTED: piggyBac transposable element-derived protein 4-like [Acropora digitifera]
MAMLHVVDPANEPDGDKLRNINSLLEFFKGRCKDLYQPRQNVAVDERIVKSRHRSGMRQFNKDKPIRWGIKLWVLADSSNGYTIDFNVYIGKVAGQDVSANGLGYDVVMKLMNPYFHQGYHLYVDNFYTSVTLFKDLFAMGVGATGTIREYRRDFPENLKDSEVWAKGKARGSIRWGRDPPCLALQWLDNKVVSMLTTIDNANVKKQVTRNMKNPGGGWTNNNVPQPGVIANYNKYMNAVDRSDQILATNNIHRKCVRWWKTLFFHLIDIAVVNSYILFQEHRTNSPDEPALKRPASYSLTNFREEAQLYSQKTNKKVGNPTPDRNSFMCKPNLSLPLLQVDISGLSFNHD